MKLTKVSVCECWPELAWLVSIRNSGMHLYCGPCVEISQSGIFEGCWEGNFVNFDFCCSGNVFGSGFSLHKRNLRFVTPTHTLDALYVCVFGCDCFAVSNSLAFLTEFCSVDLPFAGYGQRFATVVQGLDRYNRLLLETGGCKLYRICYEAFEVRNGEIATFARPSPPDFSDYAEYYRYLLDVLSRVFTERFRSSAGL